VSVWFFLWLFLSGALLYFLGWTMFILLRQKQAWKIFAAQKKMRFKSTTFLGSPEISGTIDNRPVSFFVGEHLTADARSSRKLSAIEIKLASKMPIEGGIASGGMVALVQSLNLKEEIRPDHPNWDKNYIAVASNRAALAAYLTNERIEALTSLMKIRNGWVIVIFRGDVMLLRYDTPDPLDTLEKLNKILQKILDVAGILELKPGEEGLLKSEAAKKPAKQVNLSIDDRDLKEAGTFALEEEDKPTPAPQDPSKEKP